MPLNSARMNDYRLVLGDKELKPIMVGGMGVNISTRELALEAARLGGVGHISDALTADVSDRLFGTHFVKDKAKRCAPFSGLAPKTDMEFVPEEIERATHLCVEDVMNRKTGDGLVFINCMEKLTMNDSFKTLPHRLNAALDAGIDGISLSAGLHISSFAMMAENKRFRHAKLGIVVSSVRALNIFLKKSSRTGRLPDFVVVEGPLAGGHLGFGFDWEAYSLQKITAEVIAFLKENLLEIPVIAGGGVFTGTDGVELMQLGASGIQVATRFAVTREAGLPHKVKQAYFNSEKDGIEVNGISPTGYPMRMLKISPAIASNVKPQCEAYGYLLDKGDCAYLAAYREAVESGIKNPVIEGKTCLCYQMKQYRVYTCGALAWRLRETTVKLPDGTWYEPPAAHVFNDYLMSTNGEIALPVPPAPEAAPVETCALAA